MTDGAQGRATHLTPSSNEELAGALREASNEDQVVKVVGGGTRQGYGSSVEPDIVINMDGFAGIEIWDPDDLTVTLGAGTPVKHLESTLGSRSQSAVMPEVPGESTAGGVVAVGISSLRRARLLGTRERLLEVTLVPGDGRIVRGGGRVVKNVSGFDLPRLVVGSFGSLGVITSVCMKLWPIPSAAATVSIDDPSAASVVTRPLAVLEENSRTRVFLTGTPEEVTAASDRLGGAAVDGHEWPADPRGPYQWSVRVPPVLTSQAIGRLPSGWRYLAIHGAGEIRAASDVADGATDLREWAEGAGGGLVIVEAPSHVPEIDPWGTPPPALDLQRKLIAEFDPARVINPGRLPGGL
jgi:glycolate oxidase FAD binding subunit